MNPLITTFLFLVIAFVVGIAMAYLNSKKLKVQMWLLFGVIIIISFLLTSKNSLQEGFLITAINSLIIFIIYQIILKIKLLKKIKL